MFHDGLLEMDDIALGIPEPLFGHSLGTEKGHVDLMFCSGLHRFLAEQDRLALQKLSAQEDRLGAGQRSECLN